MKLFNVTVGILAVLGSTAASGQYWVTECGGAGLERVVDVKTDASNNVYAIGDFSAGAALGGQGLVSQGFSDVFVTKLDAAGNVLWVRRAGGPGLDLGAKVSVASDGSVVVCGEFNGTADLFGTTIAANAGSTDLFVARLNGVDGSTVWVRTGGGASSDRATGIAVADDGRVLVTGEFRGAGVFDAGNFISTGNSADVFVMSYTATGVAQWFKQGFAAADDQATDVVVDAMGNSYACGQFSGDITFDQAHTNGALNQGFLVKFDDTGAEQWFRKVGGAILQRMADMQIDEIGDLVLCGDVQGTLNVYDTSPDAIANTQPSAYFLLRLGADGEYQAGVAIGSANDVGVNALDARGGIIAVYGDFQCQFAALTVHYGATGLFIANGTRDLFIAKHMASTLALSAAQQFGGHQDKAAGGLCSLTNGELLFSGAYEEMLIFPSNDPNWNTQTPCDPSGLVVNNGPYCGDAYYNSYETVESEGLMDGFIARGYVTGRQPYDNWYREGNTCDRSQVELAIRQYGQPSGNSATECGSVILEWERNVARYLFPTGCGSERTPSWDITVLWSNGSVDDTTEVFSTGWYWVSQTSSNGCYAQVDSFYVTILDEPTAYFLMEGNLDPIPPPEPPAYCYARADCVPLWLYAINIPLGATAQWTYNGAPQPGVNIQMTASGEYALTVTGANGCVSVNRMCFTLLQAVDLPNITNVTMQYTYQGVPLDVQDTIPFCGGLCMQGLMVPTWYVDGQPTALASPFYVVYSTAYGCGQNQNFADQPIYWSQLVKGQGWYPLNTHVVMYVEGCTQDSLVWDFPDSVYIVPITPPTIPEPDTVFICPGDTVALLLNCPDCQQVEWNGESVIAVSAGGDTAWVNEPGIYAAIATNTQLGFQCVGVQYYPIILASPPQLIMQPGNGIVCPGDSVLIYTPSSAAEYEWFGPSGPLNIDNDSVLVSEVGNYYLTIYTITGCSLANGPATVGQFGSPLIAVFPDNEICPNQVCALQVQGGALGNVVWNAPLTGGDFTQTVDTSGVYSCTVVSCGMEYELSVPVFQGHPDATIDVGPFSVCGGSTVVLNGPSGDYSYLWTPGNASTEDLLVTTTGNYQLQVTDTLGCTDLSDIAVVNATSFTDELEASGGQICAGATIDLVATGSGTISWYADSLLQQVLSIGPGYTAGPFNTTDTVYVAQNEAGCIGPPNALIITVLAALTPQIIGDTVLCEGADLQLSVVAQLGVTFNWTTPQGSVSGTSVNVSNATAATAGDYLCTATLADCPGISSSVSVEVVPAPSAPLILGDTTVCIGDTLSLSTAQQFGAVITWSTPQGSVAGSNVQVNNCDAENAGIYTCSVTVAGCGSLSYSVSVEVDSAPPVPALSGDLDVCIGDTLQLLASGQGNYAIVWTAPNNSNYNGPLLTIYSATLAMDGVFTCIAEGGSCPDALAYIDVQVEDCDTIPVVVSPVPPIVIPNVITPNGDGNNDILIVEGSVGLSLSIRIFNRWGKEVWDGSGRDIRWNGRNNDSNVLTDGVYYYEMIRTGPGVSETYTGYVQVLLGR